MNKSQTMLRIIRKRVGMQPVEDYIGNELRDLQRAVGGYIETARIADNAVVVFNEEGRLIDLPYNCTMIGYDFYGDIILVGVDGEGFCDFPLNFEDFRNIFKKMFGSEGGHA